MSHWYDKHGNPVWEVTGKNGKKRKPDVRDARTHDLYPSVTTVLGILAAPELENWKIEQVIRACREYPYNDGSIEYFEGNYEKGIVNEAFKKASTARDFGDILHKYLSNLVTGKYDLEYPDIPQATKDAIKKEFDRIDKILGSEVSVVDSDLGAGGTYDLFCVLKDGRTCVVDFKNQTTLNDKGESRKITVYNKSKMQAAEYAKIVNADCVVIFTISRDEPGRTEWYELTPEEYRDSKDMFKHTAGMYRLDKKLRGIKEEQT
jgi:hypothetical protein